MDNQAVLVTIEGSLGWIRLNRPEQMNAMSSDVKSGIDAAITQLEADDNVRVAILTGEGRAFSAGGDLKGFKSMVEAKTNEAFIANLRETMRVFRRIETSRLPFIAAVNGFAIAGGLELILCCDIVVAAESAQIGDGHLKYGVVPGAGSSVRLPRKVPENIARKLLLTGKLYPAARWRDWGLVDEVYPDVELLPEAEKLARHISDLSPLGLASAKKLVLEGLEKSLETALADEIEVMGKYMESMDFFEGLTAFVEKRNPRFTGK